MYSHDLTHGRSGRTTDGGSSWDIASNKSGPFFFLDRRNGCTTWQKKNNITSTDIKGLDFIDKQNGLICSSGSSGNVWRTSDATRGALVQ
jgi:hypothetical protein